MAEGCGGVQGNFKMPGTPISYWHGINRLPRALGNCMSTHGTQMGVILLWQALVGDESHSSTSLIFYSVKCCYGYCCLFQIAKIDSNFVRNNVGSVPTYCQPVYLGLYWAGVYGFFYGKCL